MDAEKKGKCTKCGWDWYKCNNCGASGCKNTKCPNNQFRTDYIEPINTFATDKCMTCGKK